MKNCCILFNEPGKDAQVDELDILDQVFFVETHLKNLGVSSYRKGITSAFMTEMEALKTENPDFVFNLTESIGNKGELLYFIPALLNMHSISYTGNPLEAMFLTTSKILTSKHLNLYGIPSPGYYLPSQWNKLTEGSKYIIKPVWEDGSMGITSDSVFTYQVGYEKRFASFSDTHWFIQDFIDGREFNISILQGDNGPEVLPPAEMIFVDYDENRPRIVDFKAKWEHNSFEYRNTVRYFPGNDIEHELLQKLKEIALLTWDAFNLNGYARIDLRVDGKGQPFVIEINANPCISEDGGFVAATIEAGYRFPEVLERIVKHLNF